MFCQLFPPLIYGGGEVLFWNLARSLASRGNQVYVITQRVRGERDKEVKDGVVIRRVGLPAEYAGALSTGFLESLAYFVEALLAGIEYVARIGVDIIHSNTYVPALAGQICATVFGRKHIVTIHDVYLISMPWFWRKWSRQQEVGLSARLMGPLLERSLLQLPASVVHTVSEASKHDLVAMGMRAKIAVIPNGIDPDEYQIDGPSFTDPHQAIYVGRLVFYKNLDLVIRAFGKVLSDVPDAGLSVIGDGPMRGSWEAITRELGLQKNISFLGRVSNKEKVRLLRDSAFLILPSLVEGFGIVILEAFACKKPVLASNIEALREVVTEGVDGYLLDASSEEAWAERMMLLFRRPTRTRRLGVMGEKKLAEHYSIERVTRRMMALYQDCLEKD
jgi:glycosyltransferase involved in cell wall biosynthesis